MHKLSVVMPAYNEEQAIASVLERIDRVADELLKKNSQIVDIEILVVNDGSTDRTEERARASPRARVVTHQKNLGYGAALKTGFLAARGDIIAFLDADGTYPPECLGRLCTPIIEGRADMTVGARDRTGESGMPFLRRTGNVLFARLLSWIAEIPVADSTSGMRVFRKTTLPRLLPLPDGLDFIAGFSTRALYERLRVLEIPIPYAERRGSSKLSVIRDGLRFLRTFITVAVTYNPLKFFGFAGLIFLFLACYLAIGPVAYYVLHGRVEDWEIYRLLTILVLCIIGLELINVGIFGNRLLALIFDLPVETRSLFGRLILSHNLSRTGWRIGLVLCLGAAVLNYQTIGQYLTLRSIYVHWSYVITGATLFLVGVQLLMTSGLLAVFRKVQERQAFQRALHAAHNRDG